MRSNQVETRFTTLSRFAFLLLIAVIFAGTTLAQDHGNYNYSYNFPSGTNYAIPGPAGEVGGVAIADFNGDGIPDVVVANGDSTVSILLGNGDGTFKPQYPVTAVPSSSTYLTKWIAVGDFNGDGYQDLAVLCVSALSTSSPSPSSVTSSINILLNKADGTGTFGAPTVISLQGTGSTAVQAAHFGNDTNFDLAVVNTGSNSVAILRGNGDGTFQTEVDYGTGSQPMALAIGDVNHDGYADLAVAAGTIGINNGVVSVLLGSANGTFGTAVNWITENSSSLLCGFASCGPPTAVVIADFNGDGKQDLATDEGPQGICVLIGNGDGTFQSPLNSGRGGPLLAQNFLAVGDWNSDGKLDLAMDALGVFLGNGDGTFPDAALSPLNGFATATGIAAADLNGDGIPDLVIANYATNTLSLARNNALTVVLNCGVKCSATTLSSSVTSSSFNGPVTFTATVTAANAKATLRPTGSVIFQDTSVSPVTNLGTVALSGGQATLAYSGLDVGPHTIVASYQGDSNFISSPSAGLAQTVNMASTTTSINSSVDPSAPGQSVTFTAMVTPSTSGVPTGTVVFSDNGTQPVSVTLDSTGSATYTTSSLTTRSHLITWGYSGDTNFQSSTSPYLTQIVGTNAAPFSLFPPTTTATVSAGQSAEFGIWIYSVPSFNSPIAFSCSGLPPGSSCNFGTNPITLSSHQMDISLYITTTASQARLHRHWSPPATEWPGVLLGSLTLAVFSLLLARQKRLTQRFALSGLGLVCAAILLGAAIGCGGNGSGSSSGGGGGAPSHTPTPSGTYQITVTGTSGSATQSFMVTVTVT